MCWNTVFSFTNQFEKLVCLKTCKCVLSQSEPFNFWNKWLLFSCEQLLRFLCALHRGRKIQCNAAWALLFCYARETSQHAPSPPPPTNNQSKWWLRQQKQLSAYQPQNQTNRAHKWRTRTHAVNKQAGCVWPPRCHFNPPEMLGCPARGHRLLCAFQRRSRRPHTSHYTLYCPLCPVPHYSSSIFKREYAFIAISLFRGQSVTLITVNCIPSFMSPYVSVFLLLLCVSD